VNWHPFDPAGQEDDLVPTGKGWGERAFPAPPRALFDIESQRTKVARLSFHLLAHPTAIWRLILFGGQIRKARAKLTNAMVALIKEL